MTESIYLDYNASTPIDPGVVDAIRPFLTDYFANPSSHHPPGDAAREAVQNARQQVADLIGCLPTEVVFTSGGSESNNQAIKGLFWKKGLPFHVITSAVEHPAVLEPCRYLQRNGATLTILPVDRTGMVDPDDVLKSITPQTKLISLMHANNEVGTIQPVAEIGRIAREKGIVYHSDAAQSVGKIPLHVGEMNIDLATIAGHKIYAPKGVGALFVRRGVQLESLVHGSGHELGRRAGTENTIGIVALGAACAIAKESIGMPRTRELRDRLWEGFQRHFEDQVVANGHPTQRLPNTLNVSFCGRQGTEVLARVGTVAASTGSACHSGSTEMSHVLKAMGLDHEVGQGAIRLSLGRPTTKEQIDAVLDRFISALS